MKKTSITFASMALAVLFFELFLRFSPFSSGVSPVRYDKDIGMWHKRNFSGTMRSECYDNRYYFNAEGILKNSYDYDGNKSNIVILGDSYIEALMVPNANIIHNQLYNLIGGRFNVLNYGLSGTAPTQHLQILKSKVDLNKVKVLIHFVNLDQDLNDVDPANFLSISRPKVHLQFIDNNTYSIIYPRPYDKKEMLRDFLGHFELLAYTKKVIYFFRNVLMVEFSNKAHGDIASEDVDPKCSMTIDSKWENLTGSMYQIKKISDEFNFDYVVIAKFDAPENKSRFSSYLTHHSIPYMDVISALSQAGVDISMLGFDCDSHWNSQTHRDVASAVYRIFRGEFE